MSLAKQWINKCIAVHACCGAQIQNSRRLPSRLIYIDVPADTDSGYTNSVRLCLSKDCDDNTHYLALSHCWGGSSLFSLTTATYQSMLQGLPTERLSRNIQDAIRITRRLGFSYIWIDSLCILQDSKEDWIRESINMKDIYAGAICTIAATGSENADGGCFYQRNSLALYPCRLVGAPDKGVYVQRDGLFDFERGVDQSPLNRRAWVFQERLLSPRILHFGSELLFWECQVRSASEISTNGYFYKSYLEDFTDRTRPDTRTMRNRGDVARAERDGVGPSWAKREERRRRQPPPAIDPDAVETDPEEWLQRRSLWHKVLKTSAEPWQRDAATSRNAQAGFRAAFETLRSRAFSPNVLVSQGFHQRWFELIGTYSRGNLTQTEDKLIAIAGVAQAVQDATGFTYLAGLWAEHLLFNLLWFVRRGPGRRPAVYRAPSWSWAALDGNVGHDIVPETSKLKMSLGDRQAEVIDWRVKAAGEDQAAAFGPVVDGWIKIRGVLCRVESLESNGSMWLLRGKGSRPIARFIPDLPVGRSFPLLFCLQSISLVREIRPGVDDIDIQGLVLQPTGSKDNGGTPEFERRGFFTTRQIQGVSFAVDEFRRSPIKTVRII